MGKQAQTDSSGDVHTGWDIPILSMLMHTPGGYDYTWKMVVLYSKGQMNYFFKQNSLTLKCSDWFCCSSSKKLTLLPSTTTNIQGVIAAIMEKRQLYSTNLWGQDTFTTRQRIIQTDGHRRSWVRDFIFFPQQALSKNRWEKSSLNSKFPFRFPFPFICICIDVKMWMVPILLFIHISWKPIQRNTC